MKVTQVTQVGHLFTEYLDMMLEFLHKTHLFPEILPYYQTLKRNIDPTETVCEKIPLTELLGQIHDKNKFLQQTLGLDSIKQHQYWPMLRKIADVSLLKYKAAFVKEAGDEVIDLDAYYAYLDTVAHSLDELIGHSPLSAENICLLHQRILSTVGNGEDKLHAGKARDIPVITRAKNEDATYHLRNYFIAHNKVGQEFQKSIARYNEVIDADTLVAIVDIFLECLLYIHVFRNGNGRLFYLLLDYLLFTHDYFPIFISQNKRPWDAIFDVYCQNRNKLQLRQNVLERILEIYSDYHIA